MKIIKFHKRRPWKQAPEEEVIELECTGFESCEMKFHTLYIVDKIKCPFCKREGSFNKMVSDMGRRDIQ